MLSMYKPMTVLHINIWDPDCSDRIPLGVIHQHYRNLLSGQSTIFFSILGLPIFKYESLKRRIVLPNPLTFNNSSCNGWNLAKRCWGFDDGSDEDCDPLSVVTIVGSHLNFRQMQMIVLSDRAPWILSIPQIASTIVDCTLSPTFYWHIAKCIACWSSSKIKLPSHLVILVIFKLTFLFDIVSWLIKFLDSSPVFAKSLPKWPISVRHEILEEYVYRKVA